MGIRSAFAGGHDSGQTGHSSGSPLGFLGSAFRTLGFMSTKALASASRLVGDLVGDVDHAACRNGRSGRAFWTVRRIIFTRSYRTKSFRCFAESLKDSSRYNGMFNAPGKRA